MSSGHVIIKREDDCDKVVDALLETDYNEEFCLALDFDENFIGRLMESGFLVMSVAFPPFYISLPKLHLERSVLFFPDLHIKKSIRPFLPLYELRVDTDFDLILDKCVQIHGEGWLTPPLVEALKNMQCKNDTRVKPVSFAVYRAGELKAGEIGVFVGRVYTSYSGYYEEKNAGTVQMILMTKWLENNGFDFLDLGMPLDYKTALGAQNIKPRHFVELFRAGRC
jgi:Leu/Phe-tRNA-protein transferase